VIDARVKTPENDLTGDVTTRYERSHRPYRDPTKVEGGEKLSIRAAGHTPPRTETVDRQDVTTIGPLGPDANCFHPRKKVGNNETL